MTLVLNNTERGLLETSEDLHLELLSSNSFLVFGIEKPEDEKAQPTLTINDWMEINSPKKNVRKKCWKLFQYFLVKQQPNNFLIVKMAYIFLLS